MSLPKITIYTDGACSPNPGPGGWGAVLLHPDGRRETITGGHRHTSNNRMELTAAIEALAHLAAPHQVELVTDSSYLQQGVTSWIDRWRRNGWRTASGQPVQNQDLWRRLLEQLQRHQVRFRWVRGHGQDRWNQEADALAVAARKAFAGQGGDAASPPDAEPVGKVALHVYTAVAKPGQQRGGWAAVLEEGGRRTEMAGRADGESANRLHLLAAIEPLEALPEPQAVLIHSPADYLVQGAARWLPDWKRRGFRTRSGQPVANEDLWRRLDAQLQRHRVRFAPADRTHRLLRRAKELAGREGGEMD